MDLDTRTVPDEIVRRRVDKCLHCSLSGHFPTPEDQRAVFVAALNDEQLQRWENYTEQRLRVSCCGRSTEEFPTPVEDD